MLLCSALRSSASSAKTAFKLPPLPYALDALTPHISAETLTYHHGKHHQAYVNKLNQLADNDKALAKMTLEDIIKTKDGAAFNQAAQIWNHTFYWNSLSPKGGGAPSGAIGAKIKADFGSFDEFKKLFSECAAGHFGSGWAWLTLDSSAAGGGKLKIVSGHDAMNPLRDGSGTPLLTCDVWEHAYYIDCRNDRPGYIKNWWELVNWDLPNSLLAKK